MKKLIIVSSLLFSLSTLAEVVNKNLMLEVNFEANKKSHQYLVTKISGKKPEYIISFKNEKNKTRSRKISQRQAELIKNDATRIIWENQYRKPSSTDSCREYVNIKTDSEKTRVCYENRASTGRAFGFLNSLNSIFK